MDNIYINSTDRTPEVDFNFTSNHFSLRGESYPEDVPTFFGPLMTAFSKHVKSLDGGSSLEFNFELLYFNSTSAKVVMNLLELLEATASNGAVVTINWRFAADDDNMQELGEEFGEDIKIARFNMCPMT
ncbi:MAG: DUF1987 domain-containing protein [Magnetococcales bacterium]|nr:DUF1987 domain-containing protein [Magnetococcales bacterium]